jgi:hypothetical protein
MHTSGRVVAPASKARGRRARRRRSRPDHQRGATTHHGAARASARSARGRAPGLLRGVGRADSCAHGARAQVPCLLHRAAAPSTLPRPPRRGRAKSRCALASPRATAFGGGTELGRRRGARRSGAAGPSSARASDPTALGHNVAGIVGLDGVQWTASTNVGFWRHCFQREGRYDGVESGVETRTTVFADSRYATARPFYPEVCNDGAPSVVPQLLVTWRPRRWFAVGARAPHARGHRLAALPRPRGDPRGPRPLARALHGARHQRGARPPDARRGLRAHRVAARGRGGPALLRALRGRDHGQRDRVAVARHRHPHGGRRVGLLLGGQPRGDGPAARPGSPSAPTPTSTRRPWCSPGPPRRRCAPTRPTRRGAPVAVFERGDAAAAEPRSAWACASRRCARARRRSGPTATRCATRTSTSSSISTTRPPPRSSRWSRGAAAPWRWSRAWGRPRRPR